MSKARRHTLAYIGLTLLFLIAVTQWARDARDRVDEFQHGEEYVRDPFNLDPLTTVVANATPEAEAAGVRNGDVLVGVEGRPLEGLSDYHGALRRAKLGDQLRLQFQSPTAGGVVTKAASIELAPFTYLGFTKQDSAAYTYIVTLRIAIPLFCLALGFWVAAVRVGDAAAWQLLLLMLSVATAVADDRTIYGNEDALQPFLTAFTVAFSSLTPVALVFFGIVFPERLAFDRRFPWIKWVALSPILFRAGFNAVFFGLQLHHHAQAVAIWPVYRPFANVLLYVRFAAFLSFLAALAYKTVVASSRDARRRLLLLDLGTAIGVIPLASVIFLSTTRGFLFAGWAAALPAMMLLAFPLSMAYVIVVHRAMDVRVVVRQGLQYMLARGGVRILQATISVAIIVTAATMSVRIGVVQRVLFIAFGFLLLAGVRGFAGRLRGWIDRQFFREAYEADAILSDLATTVTTILETEPLLRTITARIGESLHVPRIAILLNGGGKFRPAYAVGYPSPPAAEIPEQGLTVKRLRDEPHALVEFDDEESWVQQADEAERASLLELKSELLLSLSLKDKLLGIMSLGPKQSDEPYSGTDIRLLDSVAAQAGLALENGRLTEAIKEEVAAREKARRELEIAHEVQERLFPQAYPPVTGLDYAGACRPARGVGGDYYDFIMLSSGELGIAIGDVSGKGMPAALLMATLRAYLRGQTIQHQKDLTAVMANLNQLVYESSAANRYATFFYAEFNPSSRVLNYVNAGHNPPMLFRKADKAREVVRLDVGGLVIGLMEHCVYAQASVTLEAGDLLVAYTDGVSEAMNASDDEWGEERLIDAVRASCLSKSEEIIERVMEAADRFVAGAAQYDDMTLVVVRTV